MSFLGDNIYKSATTSDLFFLHIFWCFRNVCLVCFKSTYSLYRVQYVDWLYARPPLNHNDYNNNNNNNL